MKYAYDTTKIAVDHMTAACCDNPEYGGYACSFRLLGGNYRYGVAKFDAIALSTISNRDGWQTAAFPCLCDHDRGLDWFVDYTHPIKTWGGTGQVSGWKHADEWAAEVKAVCLDCADRDAELNYLLAYVER